MLTSQTGRLIPIMIVMAAAIVLSLPNSHPTTAQQLNYDEEVKRGKDLYGRGRYLEALRSFQRASELRENKSAECFGWMADALLAMGAYKQAIDSADACVAFADGDRHILVRAYNNKGLALQALAKQRDELLLRDAEATFRQGIALPGAPAILRYNLGVTLLQLNRDEEGLVELREYLKQQPHGNYSETARQLIANTRRARENYAPDFSLTTAEGEHITLADLRGKVVLLDFWASWCGPCVQSVPELRDLHRRYRRDGLVIIGISSDGNEQIWKEFTTRTRMLWPQYLDETSRLHDAFNVRALPTYILLDQEGIVRFMAVGWQKPGKLDNAILKHIKLGARD